MPIEYPEPLISILTPVYNTDIDVLELCVQSVLDQTYGHWELCLVDDASPAPHVWPLLQEIATRDPRILIGRREVNGGIVAASNDCAALANGDVVSLLDHDDALHPSALRKVADAFVHIENVDYVYSDEDVVDPQGRRVAPFYKPDWSPERFRCQMYTCHLSSIRRELFDRVGGFRDGFDGSQDWDLVLRVTEQARRIVHLPEILYHWRTVPTSVLAGDGVKPYAYEAAKRAIAAHCERVGIDGEVEELERRGHFRVRRSVDEQQLISIVIPTRGGAGRPWGQRRVMVVEAVRSVVERSTYENIEIVVVYDSVTPQSVLDELRRIADDRLRLIEWTLPFDFSAKCNLGAAHAAGDLLLFLNDDVEVITADWLDVLSGFLREDDVGAAGAHLLFEDGRLQHGGHVHLNGMAGHLMFGQDPHSDRNRLALWLDREVAGVTAACLMTRADVFSEVGGFSSEFPNNYNDVDLSLKIRSTGRRIVVSPHARLFHFESITRDPTVVPTETRRLHERWYPELHRDPYYNPNHLGGLDSYPEPMAYP
ncbi:MAG TPA: glycosyltransferase [Microthrixaceae bacterium]|nr:glycosyltransferase [Microthrixaceae bacterium]